MRVSDLKRNSIVDMVTATLVPSVDKTVTKSNPIISGITLIYRENAPSLDEEIDVEITQFHQHPELTS